MQGRTVIGGLLIFGALAVAAVVLFFRSQELYFTVDELAEGSLAELSAAPRLQVRGRVDYATVERPAEGLELRFTLTGESGRLPVVYSGLVPDTFDQAEQVTVGGHLRADGTFVADQLFVQCPSKYEAVPPGATQSSAQVGGG